jgi:hypothetical protein
MNTHKTNLIAPTLEDPQENPLPNNQISVSKNSNFVVIRINTSKLPAGTEVTAKATVLPEVEWTETKKAEGVSVTFRLLHAFYKLHAGKNAEISYAVEKNESEVLVAPIVP